MLAFTPSRRHPCHHRQACSPSCSDQAASAKWSWLGFENKRQLLLMPWPSTHPCSHTHTHQVGPLSIRRETSLSSLLSSAMFFSKCPYNAPCPVPYPIRVASMPLCLVCTQPLRASFIFNRKHDLPSQREVTWGDRCSRAEGGEGGPLPAPHLLLSHRRA